MPEWNFQVVVRNADLITDAFLLTVGLTGWICLIGTVVAIPLALAMRTRDVILRGLARSTMEVLRALPLLVFLIAFYYIVPSISTWSPAAYTTAAIVGGLNLAAFLADILRGAAEAVPEGHVEAGRALGMSEFQIARRITIPEITRRAFPSMLAFYISAYKLTSLASVIGVQELLYTARQINTRTPAPLEIYTTLAGIYVVTVVPLSFFARSLEKTRWFAVFPTSNR